MTEITEYFKKKSEPVDFTKLPKDVERLRINKKEYINWNDNVFKEALIVCKEEFTSCGVYCSFYTDQEMIKACLNPEQSKGVDSILSIKLDLYKPSIEIYSKIDHIEFDKALIFSGIYSGLHTLSC